MKINIPVEQELTLELIKKIVVKYQSEFARLKQLKDYYDGKSPILSREDSDGDYNTVTPWAKLIVDTLTGYFLGEPISYITEDEKLRVLLKRNSISSQDNFIGKDCSVYGRAYEYVYVDENKDLRIDRFSPEEIIPIYDDSIKENLICVIRVVKTLNMDFNTTGYRVEVYDDKKITTYKSENVIESLKLDSEVTHPFNAVPVIEYKNNADMFGDYQQILSLIDAYDNALTDAVMTSNYFADAYLMLRGVTLDKEDVDAIREKRIMVFDDSQAGAGFLEKGNAGTQQNESLRDSLATDIFRFAHCPDLSNETTLGNASGISIKYRMLGTENLTAIKERMFRIGLAKRMELIATFYHITEDTLEEVDYVFTRNIPTNDVENADVVQKLHNIVSDETLFSLLPFVDDIEEEKARVQEQRDSEPYYDFDVEKTLEEEEDE